MDFLYDESGSAYSFIYNGTQYYYVKNLQGDVMRIVDATGAVVANYTYDAWGKVTSSGSIGQINPIRYRGYYYDIDTGFYYLQSRYYDPAIKRFINADGYINANGNILGFNMYAYCGNNPINYKQNSISSSGSTVSSSLSVGGSCASMNGAFGNGNLGAGKKTSTPWWVSMAVGAYSDFILGMKYLATSGMHNKFAYVTNTR